MASIATSIYFACSICAFAGTAIAGVEDFYPDSPAMQDHYRSYEETSECAGPELASLLEALDARRTVADGMLAMDELHGGTEGLDIAVAVGLAYVEVGELALDKGCHEVAREILIGVIDTFEGPKFDSVRTPATIIIDDIRAASN